jgi:nucleoside-specific outer membrane channel protein Tsx
MKKKIALVALAAVAVGAQAADWSDTSLAFTTGTKYAEPFGSTNITKNIYSFKSVSGDKYGQNFFNADLLQSNSENPGTNTSGGGAQEVYAVYRRLFDLKKITGNTYAFGPVKNVGVTAGFDFNTKNDAYGSKKRMLVAGPTFMMDVKQGFFDVSLLMLSESNDPNGSRNSFSSGRYHYKNHADLSFAWGVPTGITNLSFEGWADIIASKGKDEGGYDTATETHFNGALMYDVSSTVGASKNTFKLGAGYEYWKNKFGNPYSAANDPGAFAKTPFVKAEYHF